MKLDSRMRIQIPILTAFFTGKRTGSLSLQSTRCIYPPSLEPLESGEYPQSGCNVEIQADDELPYTPESPSSSKGSEIFIVESHRPVETQSITSSMEAEHLNHVAQEDSESFFNTPGPLRKWGPDINRQLNDLDEPKATP